MATRTSAFIHLLLVEFCTVILSTAVCRGNTFSTFSEMPIHESLFRKPAVGRAPASDFRPYVHPRIVFNKPEWMSILERYARTLHVRNTWSEFHYRTSMRFGPKSPFIEHISSVDITPYERIVSKNILTINVRERESLRSLGTEILKSNEETSHALFLCAFWSSVNKRIPTGRSILPQDSYQRCISVGVKWATILIAHRILTCAGQCPKGAAGAYGYVWDYRRRFTVNHDWSTSGLSLALLYDVTYDDLTEMQRRRIRSALALLVLGKASWGTTIASTVESPNCSIHPHRCYSNWAVYHSNLYLANLAIEGESDFEPYTSDVLKDAKSSGFDAGLSNRFLKLYEAYMDHSVYPDGATFEDGYTYFIAMREGSLGLVAAARRGARVFDTPRFRNFIHIAAQMTEPWPCGQLIGHASGGGFGYPTYAALFRYVYPKGALPAMLFRQRFGRRVSNMKSCRTFWYQHLMQISILAQDDDPSVANKDSLSSLPQYLKRKLSLSIYTTRRGLIIMRNSWIETSAYVHFDARPDAFFLGHDNADRGVFTFSSSGQTWLTDLPDWLHNKDSRKHSLMHVDGLAQGERVPSVEIIKTEDSGDVAIAAADLTYGYNVQWAPGHNQGSKPFRVVTSYSADGRERKYPVLFRVPEKGSPRDFGWPRNDDGGDIGMTRKQCSIHGDPDMGFSGLWIWKRKYRESELAYAVRSVGLVRSKAKDGYVIVVDSFGTSDNHKHLFESYLILNDDVAVESNLSFCTGNRCSISLRNINGQKGAQIQVFSLEGLNLSYRVESFVTETKHSRLVIKTEARYSIELWHVMHCYSSRKEVSLEVIQAAQSTATVKYDGLLKSFYIDKTTRTLVVLNNPSRNNPAKVSPSPTISPSWPAIGTYPVSTTQIVVDTPKKLLEGSFTFRKEAFFTPSRKKFQAVLQIAIQSSQQGRSFIETVSVCRRGSINVTGNISLRLYVCGRKTPNDNYRSRDCSKLKASQTHNSFKCFVITFVSGTSSQQNYYIPLSTNRIRGKRWDLWVTHERTSK